MKRIRKLWPIFVRGLLSSCVLLGICAMLFPLPLAPLPQKSLEKDGSEPFPCQNRPCGCRSAEQCWKKCCCFNNAQKVAWAKANNVKVPDFVLAAVKQEKKKSADPEICSLSLSPGGPSSVLNRSARCENCAKLSVPPTKPSCCGKGVTRKARTSVAAKSAPRKSCATPTPPPTEVSAKTSEPRWVMAIFAAECQGQGPPAFCFPTSIVPERITLVTPPVAEIETVRPESERLQQGSLRPPLPPPKIV